MEKRIKILENGPYLVSKDIPLFEKELVLEDGLMVLKTIRKVETDGDYALCRCGHSSNMPFCDGTHAKVAFDGTETAGFSTYEDRIEIIEGDGLNLLDDNRCAYARLCHQRRGDAWQLAAESGDPESRREEIKAASDCPAGRLTIQLLDGELLEPTLEPSISFVKDIPKNVSAGLFVTGNIELESANGTLYETRNRYALCRCGASENKPFCDAMHVAINFRK